MSQLYWYGALIMLLISPWFNTGQAEAQDLINLPAPHSQGSISVAQAMKNRRTIRRFANKNLTQNQLSQLLWAAYGVTDSRGLRSAPSAGALYPLDIYAIIGDRQVSGVAAGVYHYLPEKQSLKLLRAGDTACRCSTRQPLPDLDGRGADDAAHYRGIPALPGQVWPQRDMYTHMESGHVAQNIFLQAEALGLGAGIVGLLTIRRSARSWVCRRPMIP